MGVSFLLFTVLRYFAKPAPHTMTKEWQEASNEKLLVRRQRLSVYLWPSANQSVQQEQKAEPFTGISAEGYHGKGMVVSPPAKR